MTTFGLVGAQLGKTMNALSYYASLSGLPVFCNGKIPDRYWENGIVNSCLLW